MADPETTWCLADEHSETVLVYSLAGMAVKFAQALPREAYTGLWFDPKTGKTQPAEVVGRAMVKPTAEAWLLLLRTK
jgi:hypothetical protein